MDPSGQPREGGLGEGFGNALEALTGVSGQRYGCCRTLNQARRVLADWKLMGCSDPHGMAIDPSHTKLFVSCPAGHMAVVSIARGRHIGLVRIGRGTDTAGFDPVHDIALSSDGDGTLGIVADSSAALGDVPTEKGAPNHGRRPGDRPRVYGHRDG